MPLPAASLQDPRADTSGVNQVCLDAIGMNRTFAGLHEVLFRTRILALNAQIVCAQVGPSARAIDVMVQELVTMGESLSDLVKSVESVFADSAEKAAVWLRAQQRLNVLDAAMVRFARLDTDPPLSGAALPAPTGTSETPAERPPPPASQEVWLRHVRALSHGTGQNADATMQSLREMPARLERLLDRLNLIATRNSSFLATTVAIETSRLRADHPHLGNIAEDIQRLAGDISGLEHLAVDRVRAYAILVEESSRR